MEAILDIAYIIVAAIAGGLLLAASIARIVLIIRYQKSNRSKLHNGITGSEAARMLLDSKGMQDVEVKKNNWFTSLILGNRYSVNHKCVYLRKNIYNKNSVTAVGVACQKVGLAVMDREGNKSIKVRAILQPIIFLAPYAFIPLVILGVILDLVFYSNIGVMSLVFLCIGLALLLVTLVYTILTYKLEKQGNKKALEYIKEAGFMDEQDIEEMQEVFKTFEIAYLLELLATIADIFKVILQLISKIVKSNKRSNS